MPVEISATETEIMNSMFTLTGGSIAKPGRSQRTDISLAVHFLIPFGPVRLDRSTNFGERL